MPFSRSAHVIIPTHSAHDTLRSAVLSALDQTLSPQKVTIIGDGATEKVCRVAQALTDEFPTVEFLNNPKLNNRGEKYRDDVIQSSEADFISYLCDDDLYLPNHLEVMAGHLAEFDFVHPRPTFVNPDGTIFFIPSGIESPLIKSWHTLDPPQNSISLTGASHTLQSYRALEHGWDAGPPEVWTDLYMWVKFFAHPDVTTFTSPHTTTIKLMYTSSQRENHERERLIEQWFHTTRQADTLASFQRTVDTHAKETLFRNTAAAAMLGSVTAERDSVVAERDSVVAERDAVVAMLGSVTAERNAVVAERDALVRSKSWKITQPLRDVRRFFEGMLRLPPKSG